MEEKNVTIKLQKYIFFVTKTIKEVFYDIINIYIVHF